MGRKGNVLNRKGKPVADYPRLSGARRGAGKLNAPGAKPVTPQEMELSRLLAERIRLKRECKWYLFNREVIGWSLKPRMTADIVTDALPMADAFEYIEVFYNRKRRHSTLGYKSPIQFRTGSVPIMAEN
jgi:transposase InsO family protein